MTLPDLTIGVCSYERPYYTLGALLSLRDNLRYAGARQFIIAGKDTEESLGYYRQALGGLPLIHVPCETLAQMVNAIAHHAGDVWFNALDDVLLRYPIDITSDAEMLLAHPEIGSVRMVALSDWGSHAGGDPETTADLIVHKNLHWWRIDKARSADSYMTPYGACLFHRRYWDAYGDIPDCPVENPGIAECHANARFRAKDGPTVAIPMRFGEDTQERPQPFQHVGLWHADNYVKAAGTRIREIWFRQAGHL